MTESMFEDEDDLKPLHFDEKEKVWTGGRWQRIEAGSADCLDSLP